MVVSYAPFDETPKPQAAPKPQAVPKLPHSDDTECNYIVMAFVGGIILMGIIDSLRK